MSTRHLVHYYYYYLRNKQVVSQTRDICTRRFLNGPAETTRNFLR